MTTITKTTAAAVSRKLNALGFDKWNAQTGIGVGVWNDGGIIRVANHGYLEGTAAMELKQAGYEIDRLGHTGEQHNGTHMEIFVVVGRVEA